MAKTDKAEKKGGKGKIIAIVVVVLLVFGMIGSCGSDETESAGNGQQATQQSAGDTQSNEAQGNEAESSVDKSLLQNIMQTAAGNEKEDYTAESYAVLIAALDAGREVLADDNATQEQVDEAREAVTDAVSALVEADPLTMGEQMAVEKALDYLAIMHFSKEGLVEQLEFEGFSTDEATFAVDYISVDWNEQAAGKAQDYIDTMSFSRSGLIDQLLFEGFTQEQAEYGVSAVGY